MDFGQMFGKLQEAQQKMEEVKSKLNDIQVEGEANGVVVVVTGNRKIVNVDIPQNLITNGDKEQLEDLITIAFTRAIDNADAVNEKEMKGVAGSMLPGFPGL